VLYPAVIASAKHACDLDTDDEQGGSDPQLIQVLQEEYSALVRRISRLIPDFYTESVECDLAAVPDIQPGQYIQVRKVEKQIGDRFVLVPPADPNTSGSTDRLCWRQLGPDIEILPSTVTTGVFRLEYIPAATLPNATTHLDLPEGLEGVLVHMLAKRIRIRLDQGYKAHDDEIARIWAQGTDGLVPTSAQPRTISDYNADEDCW
jgi:hypothetical protein